MLIAFPKRRAKKARRMRILRTYQRVAFIDHFCDRCMQMIMPGDVYEGYVEVGSDGKLRVFKNHVMPHCDYPTEPSDEESGFKSVPKPRSLPRAA